MRMPPLAAAVAATSRSSFMTSKPSRLFVYGTLMAPEVMETLLGRLPPCQPARLLKGCTELNDFTYTRHPVKNHVFPGLLRHGINSNHHHKAAGVDERSGVVVDGLLYQELTEKEWKRLDWFEGSEYELHTCQVLSRQDGDEIAAKVYVWSDPLAEDLDVTQSWSYDQFRTQHLQWYLKHTVLPCRHELDQMPGF